MAAIMEDSQMPLSFTKNNLQFKQTENKYPYVLFHESRSYRPH